MTGRWESERNAPYRERAKTLALIFGCIVIGVLYALGGIAVYLRRNVLVDTPMPEEYRVITRAPQVAPQDVGTIVIDSPEPEQPPAIAPGPTEYVPPTLYPTMTSSTLQGAARPDTSSQPAQPTGTPATTAPSEPTVGQPDASQSAKATDTLYPTATPRNDPTEPPPAPPTREGR